MSGRKEYTAEKPWCQPEFANDNAAPAASEHVSFRAVLAFVASLAVAIFLAGPWS